MKKVVAFNGSPRQTGHTLKVVNEVLDSAKETGAETKLYNLNDMNIKPCQSCFYCRTNEGCAINDDMQSVYQDMKEADAIVIGAPIYFGQVSGQTKVFMDRLFPLIDASFNPRFGTKRAALVYTQGNNSPETFKQYIDYNTNLLKRLGWHIDEPILCYGTNAHGPDAGQEVLESAVEAGKRLTE